MAHQIHKADTVPSPSIPQSSPVNAIQNERDHLLALRRRLEVASEALTRVHDHLQARASGCQDSDEAGHSGPDGGRQ